MFTKVRGKVDLTDWTLRGVEAVTEIIETAMRERAMAVAADAIDTVMEEADAFFSEAPGCEPLDIEVGLPTIAVNEAPLQNDDWLVYRFNLRDALGDMLDDCREDGSDSDKLRRISDALKELVSEIDDATNGR